MTARAKRIALAAAMLSLVAAFFASGLWRQLSLEALKEARASVSAYYGAHPVMLFAAYVAVYIAVAALSLPGAAVMTLGGGAVFGLWVGTMAASVGSTLGALVSCALTRYMLRHWAELKLGPRMVSINREVERDGAFYLFSLRLVPVIPFFVINMGIGLTRMPLGTFTWVSWAGMIPVTVIYVNAGRALGEVDSLRGLVSPELIASLVALGLFPLVARKLMGYVKRRRHDGP